MIKFLITLVAVIASGNATSLIATELTHQRLGEIYFSDKLTATHLDYRTLGEANGECQYVEFDQYPSVAVMVIDGIIQRVDIAGASYVDSQNIFYDLAMNNQSLDEFKQKFPQVEVHDHEYLPGVYLYWYNAEQTKAMVVDYINGKVDMVKVGLVPAVLWVEGCA